MGRRKKYKWDVALSFAGEDREIAEKLATSLKAKGLAVFYYKDHKSYLWGKERKEFDAIYGRDSRFVSPIVSKHYAAKDWPRYEFDTALRESKKRRGEFILPIRLDDTRMVGLHYDAIYLDLREDGIRGVVRVILDKCGSRSTRRNVWQTRNKRVVVLPACTRRALGIVVTSVFPLGMKELRQIFPQIQWEKEVRSLRRKRLLMRQTRLLDATRAVQNALLSDRKDVEEFNRAWVEALEPLREHIDVALMLSLHYLRLDRFEEAAGVAADIVERMEANWWSGVYLTLLRGMTNKKFLSHLKAEGRSRLYNAIGLCLLHRGENTEAVRWFLRLRRYSSKGKDNWGIGQSYINCGAAYYRSGNREKARACYVSGIEHARAGGDDILLARSLGNLAQIVAEKSLEEAQALIEESIAARKRGEDLRGLAVSYGSLGFLSACGGRLGQAREWFSKSLKKARALNSRHVESLALFNLGNVSYERGMFGEAHSYYRQSREIAEEEGCTGSA